MIREVLNEITPIKYGLDWGKDISLPKKYNNKIIIKYLWKRVENFVIANPEKLHWDKINNIRYIEDLNYKTKWTIKIAHRNWLFDGMFIVTIIENNSNSQCNYYIRKEALLQSYTFGVSVISWLQDTFTKILNGEK